MNKEKITISEIVDLMSAKNSFSKKQTEEFVKMLLSTIEDVLVDGEIVKIKGFGTFKPQWNEPRKSVDVNTGEEIIVSGYYKVVFAPDNEFKELINEPLSHLQSVEQTQTETLGDVVETNSEENSGNEFSESKTTFESVKIKKEPMRVFEEQAEQIKDLLTEIGALSTKNQEFTKGITDTPDFIEDEEDDEEELSQEETDVEESAPFTVNEKEENIEFEEETTYDIRLSRKQRKKLEKEERKQRRREEIQHYFNENEFAIIREIHPGNEEKTLETPSEEHISESEKQPENTQEEEEVIAENESASIDTETSQEPEEKSEEEIIPDSGQEEKNQTSENQEIESVSEQEENTVPEPETLITESAANEIVSNEDTEISENETTETPQTEEEIPTTEETTETPNIEKTQEQVAAPLDSIVEEEIKENPVNLVQQGKQKSVQKDKAIQTADNKSEDINYTFTPTKKKRRFRWWLIVLLALVAGAATYSIWFFFPTLKPYLEKLKPNIQLVAKDTVPKQAASQPQTIVVDSTLTQQNDTAYSDSIFDVKREYKDFLGAVIITPEKDIKRLAKDYYGNDAFWVYIYEANIEAIEDPKHIALGTPVKIPKLDPRLINVNNPETIKRAKKLADDYLYFENK